MSDRQELAQIAGARLDLAKDLLMVLEQLHAQLIPSFELYKILKHELQRTINDEQDWLNQQ